MLGELNVNSDPSMSGKKCWPRASGVDWITETLGQQIHSNVIRVPLCIRNARESNGLVTELSASPINH